MYCSKSIHGIRPQLLRRHLSTSVPTSKAPNRNPPAPIPREKLRALIQLYYESQTYITNENLSTVIDQEFAYKSTVNLGRFHLNAEGSILHRDLVDAIERRKSMPRISEWNPSTSRSTGRTQRMASAEDRSRSSWSAVRGPRENMVVDALYGVIRDPDCRIRQPGLEVLEEEAPRLSSLTQEWEGNGDTGAISDPKASANQKLTPPSS